MDCAIVMDTGGVIDEVRCVAWGGARWAYGENLYHTLDKKQGKMVNFRG